MTDDAPLKWIKASKSIFGGACVELASAGAVILLRDSKNPSVHLSIT